MVTGDIIISEGTTLGTYIALIMIIHNLKCDHVKQYVDLNMVWQEQTIYWVKVYKIKRPMKIS